MLQCIARCVSFPSVVVCASALQVICGFAFLQCSCVCCSGVTALVVVIHRINHAVGGLTYGKAKNAPYRLE